MNNNENHQLLDEARNSNSHRNGFDQNAVQSKKIKSNVTDASEDINDVNESSQLSRLKNELKKSQAEIVRLNAKIITDLRKNETDVIIQRNELLKMVSCKDNTIERMSSDIVMLEKQLKAAEDAKFDALCRLDSVKGQELTILFQKKQLEMMKEEDNNSHQVLESTTFPYEIGQTKRSHVRQKVIVDTKSVENDKNNLAEDYQENKDDSNSTDIQLELWKQVRTRRQNKFLLDAFNRTETSNPESRVNEELVTRNDKKARVQVQDQPNGSGKTPNRGRPGVRCIVKLSKVKF